MSLVPGAKLRLISKAGNRYEGTLVSVDEEQGKLALARVRSLDNAADRAQSSSTAEHIPEYVVFLKSELVDIKVLDASNPWSTDSAVVKEVENCYGSRAIAFTNEVLTWIERDEKEKVKFIVDNAHLHESFQAARKTLLHCAVQRGNLNTVQKLLAMGLDVDVEDLMGMTPLMLAMAEYKKYKELGLIIMKALLAAGADILSSE